MDVGFGGEFKTVLMMMVYELSGQGDMDEGEL
jgi:hypothetical protein